MKKGFLVTVSLLLLSGIPAAGETIYWTDIPLTERNCKVPSGDGFSYVNNSTSISEKTYNQETKEWELTDEYSREKCIAKLGTRYEGYIIYKLQFTVGTYTGEGCQLFLAEGDIETMSCEGDIYLESETCECVSDPCKALPENVYRSNASQQSCNDIGDQLNGYVSSDGVVEKVWWDNDCGMCKVQFQTCPEYTKPNSEGICVALPNELAGDHYCSEGYTDTKAMFKAGLSFGELKPGTCYTTYACKSDSEIVKYEQMSCGVVSFDGTDISDGLGTVDTKVHKLTFDGDTNETTYETVGDSVTDGSEYNAESNYTNSNNSTTSTGSLSDANTGNIVDELVKINGKLLTKGDLNPLIDLGEDIKDGIGELKDSLDDIKEGVGNVTSKLDDVKDSIDNLDKSAEAMEAGQRFGNEVTSTFKTFVFPDLLGIGSVSKSVPTITVTLRGQTYTLLSEAMLMNMGFDVQSIRAMLIVLAAISGFLSVFRGGE